MTIAERAAPMVRRMGSSDAAAGGRSARARDGKDVGGGGGGAREEGSDAGEGNAFVLTVLPVAFGMMLEVRVTAFCFLLMRFSAGSGSDVCHSAD